MAPENTTPLSEQEQFRLDKLNRLIHDGKNPYEITLYDRTHTSSEIIGHYRRGQDDEPPHHGQGELCAPCRQRR